MSYCIQFWFQDALSESMSTLKSMAQQAVMNAGLENQIPPTSIDSTSSDTKGTVQTCQSKNWSWKFFSDLCNDKIKLL